MRSPGVERCQGARNAEVGDFEAVIRRDQHVVRFDVAVHQAGAMSVSDARAGLYDQRDALLHREAAALAQQGLQVRARHQLHDDEGLAVVDAVVVYGDDIGMREVGSRPRFTLELQVKIRIAALRRRAGP